VLQRIERVAVDACAVKQVAGQQNDIAVSAQSGKLFQSQPLFFPA